MATLFAATYPGTNEGARALPPEGGTRARPGGFARVPSSTPRAVGNAGVLGRAPPAALPDAVRRRRQPSVVRQSPTGRHESGGGLRPRPGVRETDLREVFPAVRVPTLVLYRSPMANEALKVAARIASSRAMRVSGNDCFGIFLSLDAADEIGRFVAGEEALYVPDSVLATIMFRDIVGSTERAARLGDRAWNNQPLHSCIRDLKRSTRARASDRGDPSPRERPLARRGVDPHPRRTRQRTLPARHPRRPRCGSSARAAARSKSPRFGRSRSAARRQPGQRRPLVRPRP
jgi:hypothetical protein